MNLAGIAAGAPSRAPETAARSAPTAEAPARRKPSKFSLLLAGLIRGWREGSGTGTNSKARAPGKARSEARSPGPAAEAVQVRPAAAQAGAGSEHDGKPAKKVGEPGPADGTGRAGQSPARRTARRAQESLLVADLPAAGKRTVASPGPGQAIPADGHNGVGQRPPGEARSRPASGPRVFVVDLRRPTRPSGRAGAAEPRAEAVARRSAAAEPASRENGFAFKEAGFERQLARAAREAPAQEGQPPLLRALQERVIPQIVQRTGIILRDGGEGEIRLVLKPEHLGAVRVRLHLGESSLEGRIVVDNNIVKELLEANLEHLKSALRQEGFASPNIEVSVGGGRSEGRTPADSEQAGGPLPAVPGEQAREFERGAPMAWEAGLGYSTVNIWI